MRLSTWTLVVAVLVITTVAPHPAVAELGECADADGDDRLSVSDGVQVLRAAAGLPSPCTLERCDVDGSGAVTVSDGVGVLWRAAGLPYVLRNYACPIPTQRRDFSGFVSFDLTRRSAMGFCPPIGSVLSAHLDRREDGSVLAHLTTAAALTRGDPRCLDLYPPPIIDDETCIAEMPQADRVLTDAEQTLVRAAFSAVETYQAPRPECAIIAYDPCRIDALAWDGELFDDYPCHGSRIEHDVVAAVTAVLDGLLVADEAPAP